MEHFLRDLRAGDLHLKDRWQFELKSEILPHPLLEEHLHKQEFYLFIPNTLQINPWTYSKEQFYFDESNFIRYKTPEMTISELCDLNQQLSPLARIDKYISGNLAEENLKSIVDEIKLMGNIIRSALRRNAIKIIDSLSDNSQEMQKFWKRISDEYHLIRSMLNNLKARAKPFAEIAKPLNYVDEYISNTYNYYLIGILEHLRANSSIMTAQIDQEIVNILKEEEAYRSLTFDDFKKTDPRQEYLIYRKGLLNKFMLEALILRVNRFSTEQKWGQIIAAFSAFLAMLIFYIFFLWQGSFIAVNGLSFILITSILYILKDRLKEWLKILSHKQASIWFSDYTTKIKTSHAADHTIGQLQESFSFVDEKALPKEIVEIRNREFHEVLEAFKRPENVIYYKKEMRIHKKPAWMHSRRYLLNVIFRFNIQKFMEKAGGPYVSFTYLERGTDRLTTKELPKVYHLNIIMKSTSVGEDLKTQVDFQKYRLVVNKAGIQRVEHLGSLDHPKLFIDEIQEGFRQSVDDISGDHAES